jgi:DNA (cytosine-5)-methyltransferase 1
MRVLDLFAGIGGFTLGLEKAGFETVAFCEIEPYAQKVLAKNWPEIPIYDDVRKITADRLISDRIRVDVITGGFPCQDISVAGNQAGIEGERSGLWTECARLIRELRPRYAIFENVTNLLNGERGAWFKRVLWDISALGYDAEWHCIPASELGAHHHRDRVWIIAYPEGQHRWHDQKLAANQAKRTQGDAILAGIRQNVADALYPRLQRRIHWWTNQERKDKSGHLGCGSPTHGQSRQSSWDIEPDVGRVANGVPARSHRLKCLGNAVVPPIPELIGRAIKEAEA